MGFLKITKQQDSVCPRIFELKIFVVALALEPRPIGVASIFCYAGAMHVAGVGRLNLDAAAPDEASVCRNRGRIAWSAANSIRSRLLAKFSENTPIT